MVNNLKNLILVRNMKKKNLRFGASMNDINDVGFAILSYEDDKSVGRFIFCNKIACGIFGVSEEQIVGESVINIMPEMTRDHHEMFIKRFHYDGMPRLFGRVRSIFIKDFNDFVVPCQFFLNFFYSSQFSYSLIMHVDPIQYVTVFGTQTQVHVKNCMFFLCDEYNQIVNFSQSCKKIIGFSHRVKKVQEEILGRAVKMDDVLQ
jgi:PAS domain-containing protein